jgi:hypothetical protein
MGALSFVEQADRIDGIGFHDSCQLLERGCAATRLPHQPVDS